MYTHTKTNTYYIRINADIGTSIGIGILVLLENSLDVISVDIW